MLYSYTIASKVAPHEQNILGYVPHIYVFRTCASVLYFVFDNERQRNTFITTEKQQYNYS